MVFDDGYRFILQLQNGSSVLGTFVKYGVLKCSTGMSCSVSGSTFTMTASGWRRYGYGDRFASIRAVSGLLRSDLDHQCHRTQCRRPINLRRSLRLGYGLHLRDLTRVYLADGDVLLFQADLASGASPTLVVNGQAGTPALNKNLNGALVALSHHDLVAGGDYLIEFDGTNWQVQGNLGTAYTKPAPPTHSRPEIRTRLAQRVV